MQKKFASSFGKRRYTKGFYVDIPVKVKAEKKSPPCPIAQLPAIFTQQIISLAIFQKQEIKLVQIARPAFNFHEYKKLIAAKNPVITPTKATTTTALTNPASDNAKNGSPYNKAALIFFLLTVLASIITATVAIAITPTALTLALYIGFIVTALLDLAAVLSALLSLNHHEEDTDAAKIVLILNGIIVLGWLITLLRRNIR